jgi:hypothetical protein
LSKDRHQALPQSIDRLGTTTIDAHLSPQFFALAIITLAIIALTTTVFATMLPVTQKGKQHVLKHCRDLPSTETLDLVGFLAKDEVLFGPPGSPH